LNEQYFSKEEIQMTNKYMNRCSIVFAIREMKNRIAMKFGLAWVGMLVRMWTKSYLYTLLVGMEISIAPIEHSKEVPETIKGKAII
jgi:hypothetical protein